MGVRYLEANENVLPVGYEIRQQKGYAVLAEREDVLPLCYGTTELLSEDAYRKLHFPENLEALTARSVVAGENRSQETDEETQKTDEQSQKTDVQSQKADELIRGDSRFESHFEELSMKEGQDYEIQQISKKKYTITPKEAIMGKILAVTFRVEPKSESAVLITINGITNKLSGASAAYPNGNKNFTYILSSPKPMEEFTVKTSGSYEISDVHVYSMDAAYLGNRTVYPLEEQSGKTVADAAEQEERDEPEDIDAFGPASGKPAGRTVASGSITMPEDGYFVTSYPYQSGYRAYVDGKAQEIEKVNTAFVGFPLEAGTHEIRLTYEPPLQKAGMVLSAVGWVIWLGMLISQVRRSEERK